MPSKEYMREYRARKKAQALKAPEETEVLEEMVTVPKAHWDLLTGDNGNLSRQVTELEEEVARLKQLLAARPAISAPKPIATNGQLMTDLWDMTERFGQSFPAPKPGTKRKAK